jgi:hypothetical protein
MGYSIVPAYMDADPGGQAALGATADTFAAIALVSNAACNFLGWGVVVPLYAVAILTTRVLPRWIGWLGLLVGALAGWLGLLSPHRRRSRVSPTSASSASSFRVEHGYRAAPAALESRRSKPGIITATDLTKGRIDLFKTPRCSALEVKKPQNVGALPADPGGRVRHSDADAWRCGMFLTTQPFRSAQTSSAFAGGLPALF